MTLIRLLTFAAAPLVMVGVASAQSPAPADPSLQFVDSVMKAAAAMHDLVRGMNLQNSFGAYPPGDPRANQRTAEFIGMGAGVGMALGEMSKNNQKSAMIGAAAGAAGGLIVDQILRRQAAKAYAQPAPDQIPPDPPAKQFKQR